jgi:hypothetical protein
MAELAKLPKDMVFFTQITMESAEDPERRRAAKRETLHPRGAADSTPVCLRTLRDRAKF